MDMDFDVEKFSFTKMFTNNLDYFIENEIIYLYAHNENDTYFSGSSLKEAILNQDKFLFDFEFNYANPLVEKIINNFKRNSIEYKTTVDHLSSNRISIKDYKDLLIQFPGISDTIEKNCHRKSFFGAASINQFKTSQLSNRNIYYGVMSNLLLLYLNQDNPEVLSQYSAILFGGQSYLNEKHFAFLNLITENVLTPENTEILLNKIIQPDTVSHIFYYKDHGFNHEAFTFCRNFANFGERFLLKILETAFSNQHYSSSTYNQKILDRLNVSDTIQEKLSSYCQFSINELDNISLNSSDFEFSSEQVTSIFINYSQLLSKYSEYISASEIGHIFSYFNFSHKITNNDVTHFLNMNKNSEGIGFKICSKFSDSNIELSDIHQKHQEFRLVLPLFLQNFIFDIKKKLIDSREFEPIDSLVLFEQSLNQLRENNLLLQMKNIDKQNDKNNNTNINRKI